MSAPDTVLLLHGLWMNRFAMLPLARALKRAGFATLEPSYPSMRGNLQDNVDALALQLDAFCRNLPASAAMPRIHIVGHSLGGLLALALLQREPVDPRLGRVVLLGSPVAGCSAARDFATYPGGEWLLGETTPLWERLPMPDIPAGREVGAIAGTRRIGLASLLVGIEGEHDGVVRVEETRLPGLADHRVLPVSHTGMLLSAEVAAQCVAFLRHGRFR